jgi:HNH endonuclease
MTQKQIPAQQYLKENLEYDPETGHFTWRTAGRRRLVGGRAGTRNKVSGYRLIYIDGCAQHYEHRLAWLYVHGEWPKELDHINGVRDDNRIANLRSVNRSKNSINSRIRSDNKSGVKGVYYDLRSHKWSAEIIFEGEKSFLGYYKTKDEAVAARRAAEAVLHREFARPNP